MSGFSIDWLDLREGADRRARDGMLRERAMQWLEKEPTPGPVVVDLGAGTGSTLRALAAPETLPLTWRLVDHDPALLAEAHRRHADKCHVETVAADLSQIGTLPLEGARLVTASALFDLVSVAFIDELAQTLQRQCHHNAVGLYAALNYDGSTHWSPAHPLDELVLEAFNLDQRRDKGFGPALGPEAGEAIRDCFSRAGFEVITASTPWQLDAADQPMIEALIDGIAEAVANSAGLGASALEDWVRFRRSRVATGTCTVGHTDVLALPI